MIHEHEHLDDEMFAADQHGEFSDASQSNLDSAGEAIAARHLEKAKQAKALAQKYKKSEYSFLSKAWFKSLHPLTHVKDNWKTIAMTTVAGGALAAAGTTILSDTPNIIAVAKTALLSYPAWRILEGGMARLGFYSGHALNAWNRDRFREVKTEPAGKWAGRVMAISLAVGGGVLGNSYMDAAQDFTIGLPSTVTQKIPSSLIDTFTNQSNTKWDPVWELPDQAGCLYWENVKPDHTCLTGPGSEAVGITIDKNIVDAAGGATAEISYFGRALDNTGVDWSVPEWVPNMPANDDMNDWALDKLGIEKAPQMRM